MMDHILLPSILLLLATVAGCMQDTAPSDLPRLEVVSSKELDAARDSASSRLKRGAGKYENWERLHESVKSCLRNHGTVSWDTEPLPDFYFSGDWFHENSDGYRICSPRPITKDLLRKLPHVLSNHHKDAILEMNGTEHPIEGLVIFATSTGVFVAWDRLDRNECKKRLRELSIELD
jgi:hypothetical protein